MSTPAASQTIRDVAVIDVGSNSVRMVLYRVEGRALWTVFNEKVLAGLGRNLAATGKLSPEGVAEATAALRRFAALLEGDPPDEVFTAATAAVREASDGPAFVGRIEALTGLKLRVLSGVEEAHFAALGVLAGAPQSRGVAGDLGGASLELIRLAPEGADDGVSLPIGPFSMGRPGELSPDRLRRRVRALVEPVAGRFRAPVFHAVGGAWRNLALLQMRLAGYPLQIVHQYEMSRREALDVLPFISRQSKGSLAGIEGVSRKRAETLPHAAAVLEVLIDLLGIETIVLSAYGVREGLILEGMAPEIRARDPVLEGCRAWGLRQGVADALGEAVARWIDPVFSQLPALFGGRDKVLSQAACALVDIGARLHPDHRADQVFDQVLRAPIAGLNHAERYFLAAVCFSRHTGAAAVREPAMAERLLSRERIIRARALGSAIRLASDLSGRSPALLARSNLRLEGDRLVVEADPDYAGILLGDQTAKRAQTLAGLLGRRLELRPRSLAKVG